MFKIKFFAKERKGFCGQPLLEIREYFNVNNSSWEIQYQLDGIYFIFDKKLIFFATDPDYLCFVEITAAYGDFGQLKLAGKNITNFLYHLTCNFLLNKIITH